MTTFSSDEKLLIIRKPSAILFDIDRTLTTRDFRRSVLDEYVMAKCTEYLEADWLDLSVRDVIDEMREEAAIDSANGAPAISPNQSTIKKLIETTAAYVIWATANQKTNKPLKTFCNMVIFSAYKNDARISSYVMTTWVYSDTATKLKAWKEDAIKLYIFGEQSKLLSKMMMEQTIKGNLDLFIESYFDTAEDGALSVPSSYKKLIEKKKIPFAVDQLLFVSHDVKHVRAARQAGIGVVLVASHLEDFLALSTDDRQNFPVIRGLHELAFLVNSGPAAATLKGDVNARFEVTEP